MDLVGKRIVLRKMREEDIPFVVAWKNDSEIGRLVRGIPIETTIYQESQRFLRSLDRDDMVRLTICHKGSPIGFLILSDIDKLNAKASLGMVIGEKRFWNQGLGFETMVLLINYLFFELGFNRLSLEVFEFNNRARGLYEKIGFKLEGRERQGLLIQENTYDILHMGLLREEYRHKE